MTSLHGQTIAITGAARGIGFATARALLLSGAKVAISDIDEAELKRAATELGVTCYARLDVTDADAFAAFLDYAESELGPITGIVNNAGIMPTGGLLEEQASLARRVLEINTLGVINGTKAALQRMVPRRRGHVVNMASTMGEAPVPGLATYNASKAAAIIFTDAARLEFRSSGIKFSTVLPGGVNTGLADGVDASISVPLPFGRSIPIVKHVEPEEVARAVVRALASGKSHRRIHVPRSFGVLLRSGGLLPICMNEALQRSLGAHKKILQSSDPAKRARYLARVRST
ncbi:SDR family oxidoreductase [Hoyosella subflava]|uniref:Dehydrogenase n=1 Tax=Hoyosella subflava (strain DSM 45089 / JCM 17490 / NBRC 109087 / DQS3-9A1) TaxID=443218 RepID=F6EQY8_HOYSD|nr:SDR family oxidoreductase [Hoyosella subflava]AEF40675.1 Dehydrogenase [Hoyosella subflava DQS3-9A1]